MLHQHAAQILHGAIGIAHRFADPRDAHRIADRHDRHRRARRQQRIGQPRVPAIAATLDFLETLSWV